MSATWMGRYEELIRELVRHTNIVLKGSQIKRDLAGKGVLFTPQAWQIMEYIIENSPDESNMSQIADTLQIPQSSFSRIVKYLEREGIVDRYHRTSNRKNVILKPTDLAMEIYNKNMDEIKGANFQRFFDALSKIDDDTLNTFVAALRIHNEDLMRYDDVDTSNPLVKIE